MSKTISVDKAVLVSKGKTYHSAGDSIPDLNWTATGWKHNDASYAIRGNPSHVNTLALWLDASDSSTIDENSSEVSQWSDKSGNNYHATQSTSSAKPTIGGDFINGLNVLTFGSGKSISSTSPSNANWQDVYIVARWDSGSTFNNYNGLFTGTTNVNGDIGIIGNSSTSNLYTTNWFDNIFLNGTSASTSGVLGTHVIKLHRIYLGKFISFCKWLSCWE